MCHNAPWLSDLDKQEEKNVGKYRGRGRFHAPKTYINANINAANFRDNGINTQRFFENFNAVRKKHSEFISVSEIQDKTTNSKPVASLGWVTPGAATEGVTSVFS